jgi:hypothetical protein
MLSPLITRNRSRPARRAAVEKESKGMKCPHCHIEYVEATHTFSLGEDADGAWSVREQRCPTCDRLTVSLGCSDGRVYPIMPQLSHRPRPSEDVPQEYAAQYRTATEVLPHSVESSAALSRRLLHRLLSETAKLGTGGLSEQIRQAKYSATFPVYLKDALEAYRRVAKLDDVPVKSESPSILMHVERGEADWTLDVIESLFEFYFILPARLRRRQDSLEETAYAAPPEETPIAQPASDGEADSQSQAAAESTAEANATAPAPAG